jgi:CRP/FNR family transcriptional regulator
VASAHPSIFDPAVFRPLHVASCKVQCSSCNMREICLPVGLTREELEHIDRRLVASRRKVGRGETLFRSGDPFDALFAVWTGFFKTLLITQQGREQVTGFQMAGELIGLTGIDSGRHEVDAVALEDSQVCVIPYSELESLAREVPALQIQFHKIMSREIAANHDAMLRLGSMHAEERVAAFLLNLMHRLHARGFSASSMLLRMSREEIGSFLGLQLETVSRTLSKFQANGLLGVRQRQIEVADAAGLQKLLDGVAA